MSSRAQRRTLYADRSHKSMEVRPNFSLALLRAIGRRAWTERSPRWQTFAIDMDSREMHLSPHTMAARRGELRMCGAAKSHTKPQITYQRSISGRGKLPTGK